MTAVAVTHAPSHRRLRPAWRTVARLTGIELRLALREPMTLVALLGLPVVAMVVIAGVFGQTPDPEFGGVAPDDYYVASYLGVVLASLGLVILPGHVATNRDLGVTRRYRASGIGPGTIAASQVALGAVLATAASAIVLVTGHLAYDLQAPDDPGRVAAWYALGLASHLAIALALGALAPSSRAATAIGNLLFFPALLLGGGGPPRGVMSDAMRTVADALPLAHVTAGMREAWLGATDSNATVWTPIVVALAALAVAAWVRRRPA